MEKPFVSVPTIEKIISHIHIDQYNDGGLLPNYMKLDRICNSNGNTWTATAANIQVAIDDLPSGGGTVYVPAGTFILSTAINLSSNVFIAGAGWSTILKQADSSPEPSRIFYIYDKINWGIQNLQIDGNFANQTGVLAWYDGIYIDGTDPNVDSKGLIKNCYIHDCGDVGIILLGVNKIKIESNICASNHYAGIHMDNSYNNKIICNNCDLNGVGEANGYGIAADNGCKQNKIIGNTCIGNRTNGIWVSNSYENSILGNTANDSEASSGIYLNYANSINNTISGNTCRGNYVDGIQLLQCSRNTISANTCTENNYNGIGLNASSYNTISSNICTNNSNRGVGFNDGIALDDFAGVGSTNNIIEANVCYDTQTTKTQQYGIRTLNNADYNTVVDNNVIGNNVTAGIILVGSNNIVRDNQGYKTQNSGTSTGTGAQQTIAHGLAATPTNVCLSMQGNGSAYESTAADATNLYITATNTINYRWKAEV